MPASWVDAREDEQAADDGQRDALGDASPNCRVRAGQNWKIGAAGGLQTRLALGADRAFSAGHGALRVGGVGYPSIAGDGCDRTGDTLSFPKRKFGLFEVSRSVSVTADGRLLHLETVRNLSNKLELVDLDLGIEITSSQVGFESENGDDKASDADDWFVLKDDAAHPFLQWGVDGSAQGDAGRESPFVLTPDDKQLWSPSFNDGDESARFSYHADLIPGETVRFLHVSGAVQDDSAAAIAQAKDGATPFRGYSSAIARTVINWGPDADKDGVPVQEDTCPGIKAETESGCPEFIAEPVDPTDPVPDPEPEATPAPVADTTAPVISVSKVKRTKQRVRPTITCSEACSVTVTVLRGGKQVSRRSRSAISDAAFRPQMKAKRGTLKLVVTAVDAAGNQAGATKRVKRR